MKTPQGVDNAYFIRLRQRGASNFVAEFTTVTLYGSKSGGPSARGIAEIQSRGVGRFVFS